MKLNITREELLTPLQIISGVVERKQTMPVLSNILLEAAPGYVTLTGTNMEVELVRLIQRLSNKQGELQYLQENCLIFAALFRLTQVSNLVLKVIKCIFAPVRVILP